MRHFNRRKAKEEGHGVADTLWSGPCMVFCLGVLVEEKVQRGRREVEDKMGKAGPRRKSWQACVSGKEEGLCLQAMESVKGHTRGSAVFWRIILVAMSLANWTEARLTRATSPAGDGEART